MLGITDYGAFVACAVMLNLTPGTDTVYVISRSIAGGRKPGAVSALGISTGILMHTVLCASGLSIVLARSAMAFAAVKTGWRGVSCDYGYTHNSLEKIDS